MSRSRIASCIGGGFVILLALLSLFSCSESTKKDETTAIRITTPNVSSRLSSDTGEYELEDYDNLYWYYTAVKKDTFFKTGEVTEETALNNGSPGLPDESFGSFSMGKWLFQFYAYTAAEATDDTSDDALTVEVDGTTYVLTLYLSGESFTGEAYYTTLNSSNNTVDANVALCDAQEEYGNIFVYGIYITDGNNKLSILDEEPGEDDLAPEYYIIKDEGTYAVVTLYSGDTTVRTIEDSELAVITDTGLYISYTDSTVDDDTTEDDATTYLVPTGYYTIQVDLYDEDLDDAAPIGSATLSNVLVRSLLTTTVYGDTSEDPLDAYINEDISITYTSVNVSDVYQLAAALKDEYISYITFTSDIAYKGMITVSGDKVVDLNGYTMTAASSNGFYVSADSSLTISGGTVSAYTYPFYLADGASLTVEDGTYYSSRGYAAVLSYVTGSDGTTEVTINGGTFDSDYNPTIYNYSGSMTLTINDGTFTSGYYDCIRNSDDMTLVINGGTFTVDGYGDTCISAYSGDLDLTINDGTFTAPYGIFVNSAVDTASIDINGGTFTSDYFTLYVNGAISDDTDIAIDISAGTFDGEIYLAGCTDTTISGGSFYSSDMQAVHLRSGKIAITGGTFKTGVEGSYDYDYIYVSGGSMGNYGDVVIEASNSSYGQITSVTVTSDAVFENQGVSYYVNPRFSTYSAPSTFSIENDKYNEEPELAYERSISSSVFSGYVYFTSDHQSEAEAFTSTQTIAGYECTVGDLTTL